MNALATSKAQNCVHCCEHCMHVCGQTETSVSEAKKKAHLIEPSFKSKLVYTSQRVLLLASNDPSVRSLCIKHVNYRL